MKNNGVLYFLYLNLFSEKAIVKYELYVYIILLYSSISLLYYYFITT